MRAVDWKFELDGFLLSKAYKVLDEKVQKSYLSWEWRVMQSLKKNALGFKNDMMNLVNFNALWGTTFVNSIYKVSAKKAQKSYLS